MKHPYAEENPERWAEAIAIETAYHPAQIYAFLREARDDEPVARAMIDLALRLNADAVGLIRASRLLRESGISAEQFADAMGRIPRPDAIERAALDATIADIERRRRPWWRRLLAP